MQRQRILDYLRTHNDMTQKDAIDNGIYRLKTEIINLVKEGYNIQRTTRTVENKDGSYSCIDAYKLIEEGKRYDTKTENT